MSGTEDGPVPIDHRALVTSVRVETGGGHAHLSVFVRGKLAGSLVVDPDDARPLQLLLALLGAGKRCIPIENIPWLVKDFAVLYGVTERLASDIDAEKEVDLGYLKAQLSRLSPAYEACQAARRMAGNELRRRAAEVRPATAADWKEFVQREAAPTGGGDERTFFEAHVEDLRRRAAEAFDADDPRREALDKALAGIERTKRSGEGD